MANKKKLELYIRNTSDATVQEIQDPFNFPFVKVEMFKDESVTLTQTVKNVKDPAKIFTAFTQKFTVPASKKNNKIFRHFYNNGISGFDSRIKVPARLELNTTPFQTGYVKLESSELEFGRPKDYKITFFGNTTTLTQLFGEDTLRNLAWLNNFSFPYDQQEIRDRLSNFPANQIVVDGVTYVNATVVSLISNEKRFYYSSSRAYTQGDGNLYPQSGRVQGVYWEDLKPSLRCEVIFDAIEKTYETITFDRGPGTLFDDNSIAGFEGIYLHLSKKQGKVLSDDNNEPKTFPSTINNFPILPTSSADPGTVVDLFTSNGTTIFLAIPQDIVNCTGTGIISQNNRVDIDIDVNSAYIGVPYNVRILYNGSVVEELNFVSNDVSLTPQTLRQANSGQVEVIIAPTATMVFDNIKVTVKRGLSPFLVCGVHSSFVETGTTTLNINYPFEITSEIPTLKIIEFLSGIFKMYNIIAEVEFDQITQKNNIIMKPYSDFYKIENARKFDITEYVDTKKFESASTLPYNIINYRYKGLETFFADFHKQIIGSEWGTERYRGAEDGVFVGKPYNVEVPFGHQKYERLYDENTTNLTELQWGWSVNAEQQPIQGKPLIHRVDYRDEGTNFGFMPTPNTVTYIENYRVPRNDSDNQVRASLNFFPEASEWSGLVYPNVLFTAFHQEYIEGIFEQSKRMVKVEAFLPDRILIELSLADRFIINGDQYLINSIKTNFSSGKSTIELLTENLKA